MNGFAAKYLLVLTLGWLGCGPVWAGAPVPPAYHDLLRDWYQRYLGRPIEPQALDYWGRKMVREGNPAIVQADILGSGEYYVRNGGTPAGFVRALYRDVDGKVASPGQVEYWVERLQQSQRRDLIAESFLGVKRIEREPGLGARLAGAVVEGLAEAMIRSLFEAAFGSSDSCEEIGSAPPVRPVPPPGPPQRIGEPLRLGKGR